jgi:hypothetical protein
MKLYLKNTTLKEELKSAKQEDVKNGVIFFAGEKNP